MSTVLETAPSTTGGGSAAPDGVPPDAGSAANPDAAAPSGADAGDRAEDREGSDGRGAGGEDVAVFAYGTLQFPAVYLAAVAGPAEAGGPEFRRLLFAAAAAAAAPHLPATCEASFEPFAGLFGGSAPPLSVARATLAGYRRHRLRGRNYPGAVACSEHGPPPCGACRVDGVVYRLRDPRRDLDRLDAFEGVREGLYVRRPVRVQAEEGGGGGGGAKTLEAHVYLWNGGLHDVIFDRDWDTAAAGENLQSLFA